MTFWQINSLKMSGGGAEIRKFSNAYSLTTYTYALQFQIQFYILQVILGGNSCIVSLPIVILNIYFGIRYANCDMSNSVSYKIPKVLYLFCISKKFMAINNF